MRRLLIPLLLLCACSKPEQPAAPAAPRPSILLVTLDTTRADAIGPATPSFNALAARGLQFRYAYAAVPQTLPSHASMMTGLYPAGHGVHENGRFLTADRAVLAERLKAAGYRTAAFVSAFAVARRFGLSRGFDVYDDDFGAEDAERSAKATTDRAVAWLDANTQQPVFVWVHYYDPHYPYTPPEPFRTRYANQPYLGEVASMDEQLGRLLQSFERKGTAAILVVADHGEGLGDHGEAQHGNLLYQSTMHVPLVIAGPGVAAGASERPVSTRRIYHTILDWAGIDATDSLRGSSGETVVAGEAMKPFLDYGWQPQVMAVEGNLLYQSTMHVPLVIAGPGVAAGASDRPVSTRRVYHTILDWAGIDATDSLRGSSGETVVAGEAMKPFLDYGWQPQVMAVEGNQKTILAGRTEVYDVVADPAEKRDMAAQANLSRAVRATLRDYPIPSPQVAQAPAILDDESQRKLAALGYVSSGVNPVVRKDAPRPVDMASLFPILDKASGLFVREQYAAAIPLLEQIQAKDPNNLDAALRLAVSHSSLGHDAEALAAFRKAEAIAPDSRDVRAYLGLHYAKGKDWQKAVPLLERTVAEDPERVPALEALATIREKQRRFEDALTLRQKILSIKYPTPAELIRLGQLAMAAGNTPVAIDAFEKARAAQSAQFKNDLELGVLYLAAQRLEEARDALDRVPPTNPAYAMALFKRAQVSVLLREPDAPARIEMARTHADPITKDLIARERLFGAER